MDERTNTTPVIAILGRPNVGKSTLFNRLLEQKKALVSDEPGTTRDINFGHCHWRGSVVTVIDTAGLDLTSKEATEEAMKRQAQMAVQKADIVLMVGDVTTGPLPQDRVLARHLLQSRKPLMLVANKADNPRLRREALSPDWLQLGLGEPMPISAANGTGTGDMLDVIYEMIKKQGLDSKPLPDIDVRVAILGRPNVGKSSLLNALAGEERVIVSEVPHTTKEPQDTLVTYVDQKFGEKHILLVDTVGIRKRAHVEPGIEGMGVRLSLGEVPRADVVLLLVDAPEGINVQEKRLAGFVAEKHPGLIIVVNKWDLSTEKNLGNADDYRRYVQSEFPFLAWADIICISAKTGDRVGRVLDHVLEVAEQRARELPQEELDRFVEKLKKIHHSAFKKGEKRPKVYGITQTGTKPPSVTTVVQDKETLHRNFIRFVETRLREDYGFAGTPLEINAREIDT